MTASAPSTPTRITAPLRTRITTETVDSSSLARNAIDGRWIAAAGATAISLTAVFTRLADVNVATTLFYRCLIAAVPLALLAWFEIRRHGVPTRRTFGLHLLAGVLLGIDFATWTQSIFLVGAGVATILNNVQAIVVPLLAWALFRDRVSLRFVLAMPVMLVSLTLAGGLLGSDSASAPDPFLGTVLGLVSGVAYAGFILIIARTGDPRGGPNTQVLTTTIVSGIVGAGIAAFWGGIDLTPGWAPLGWLAALALGGHVLGWVLISTALPRLPVQIGASMLLLQPALAVVFAMVILAERPTAMQLLGCAGVVAMVAVVSMSRREPAVEDVDTRAPADRGDAAVARRRSVDC
ncbi:DMT family transporter [Gordonia hydrophobica]|uniref:DMT family transporter n=1 Tax=Gordonia hydrophobica TaxID=40516 RepID=A0ABZ2U789_9ACTN|nr:DMT family transporter [Gordonia hydrophobica]MBM7366127.1 drug/metabolite transporter (DMT)-like permease [Gordonia hydrophobica]